MGERAHDLMVRNKFIAAQQSCGLRRYLDGASSDAPIREIVDSCRVWESHSDREPSSKVDRGCNSLGVSGESCTVGCLRMNMHELPACPRMDSRVPGTLVGVDQRSKETPRKVEEGGGKLASLETISSLITQLLRTVQEGRGVDDNLFRRGSRVRCQPCRRTWHGHRPPGKGVDKSVFLVWTPGTWGEQMFTDGHFFSISATRMVGGCEKWPISGVTDGRDWIEIYSGKRGMVRAGGSASRTIRDRRATEPGGGRG